jgi:hypothetical protein
MKTRIVLFVSMLIVSGPGAAWIAYGFQSGISRFEVTSQLTDKESLVITEGAQQMYAGPDDNKTKYSLVYCASPQKLFLMKFSLAESRADFVKVKQKYEKRYGKPDGSDAWESANWEDVDVSFIWGLNESETILLTHSNNQTSAEFQDLSVCK